MSAARWVDARVRWRDVRVGDIFCSVIGGRLLVTAIREDALAGYVQVDARQIGSIFGSRVSLPGDMLVEVERREVM